MVNQVGFMVTGIGIGTALALNGAISHAFNDILFKSLLMMSVGAVMYVTGKSRCTDLGGLYRTMPITTVLCIVGAASISAFPLFSGFVSKSMVISAVAEGGYSVIWFMLLFASAGVFHHAGIKIPYFIFFAHDSGLRPKEPPFNMLLAMGFLAVMCILIGTFPGLLYGILPFPVDYHPYTAVHVVGQLQLLFFSALAFIYLIVNGHYPPEKVGINLDTDLLYRKAARLYVWVSGKPVVATENAIGQMYRSVLITPNIKFAQWCWAFDLHVIDRAVNGVADIVTSWSTTLRGIQTGQLQHYAMMIVVGAFIIMSGYLFF